MYPGPENSPLNHKNACCADGVRQVSVNNSGGGLPPRPQLYRFFPESRMFHPRAYLSAVQRVYEPIFMQEPGKMDLLETEAFAKLLVSRIEVHGDGTVLFQLFKDFAVDLSMPRDRIVTRDDKEWLTTPTTCTVNDFKELIKKAKQPAFNDIPATRLHLWNKVNNLERENLKMIHDKKDLSEGARISNPLATLNTVFLEKLKPTQIHIVLWRPPPRASGSPKGEDDVLETFNTLHGLLWGNAGVLLSSRSVTYGAETTNEGKNVDQSNITDEAENIDKGKARDEGGTTAEDMHEIKTHTCDVFNLQEHVDGMMSLGISVGSHLIVRQEYVYLRQELTTIFEPHGYLNGIAILGQPGIGKSLFLVYLLLARMQDALPVAIETSPLGYYLINNHGVSFHSTYDRDPLNLEDKVVWGLSDSNIDLIIPSMAFTRSPNVRVIQAASPREDRWYDWTKTVGRQQLFMDVWEQEELALLTEVQFGRQHLDMMFRICSQWGPSPHHIVSAMLALASGNISTWEKFMHSTIEYDAEELARDPSSMATTSFTASRVSSILWVRPEDRGINLYKIRTFIPNAAIVVEAVRKAFHKRNPIY
ncbi:hypothetical protein AZE42_07554 [Rhizopogon vesiculosus]|uniref:Crinkler effector protein N-terminal domain-containing protein n=1 Tax=Rhizopogon vesiculosus TaxID=180088 RepID=A0A1J8QPI0_9AGAM|nr:hypothetical protein AZE42_07554 [Rhizopogon vesiculosus]